MEFSFSLVTLFDPRLRSKRLGPTVQVTFRLVKPDRASRCSNLLRNTEVPGSFLPSVVTGTTQVKVKVKVTLQLTVSQSVSMSWCRAQIWDS
jgi:hypothetical protein